MMKFSQIAIRAALLSALLPLAAQSAEPQSSEPMTAAAFDAYTQGKVLTYAEKGETYGAEEYYQNNQVKWAFDNGECLDGFWYEKDENICFLYEDNGPPQCWTFYLEEDKLRAIFADENGTELYEAYTSDGPMQCMGPAIGV